MAESNCDQRADSDSDKYNQNRHKEPNVSRAILHFALAAILSLSPSDRQLTLPYHRLSGSQEMQYFWLPTPNRFSANRTLANRFTSEPDLSLRPVTFVPSTPPNFLAY